MFLPNIFQGLKMYKTTQNLIQEIANAGHEFWILFPTIWSHLFPNLGSVDDSAIVLLPWDSSPLGPLDQHIFGIFFWTHLITSK